MQIIFFFLFSDLGNVRESLVCNDECSVSAMHVPAREVAEARLKQLAISQAGQETCAWHAALGQFLGLVGIIVGLSCAILNLF